MITVNRFVLLMVDVRKMKRYRHQVRVVFNETPTCATHEGEDQLM